eukprot:21323-Heterococcus_DN1.PRE.2
MLAANSNQIVKDSNNAIGSTAQLAVLTAKAVPVARVSQPCFLQAAQPAKHFVLYAQPLIAEASCLRTSRLRLYAIARVQLFST